MGRNRGRFGIGDGQFIQHVQNLFLFFHGVSAQLLDAGGAILLGLQLFQFDAVLIPVQLFAKVPDLVYQLALSRFFILQRMTVAQHDFRQATRFGQLNVAKRLALQVFGETFV